MTQIPPGKWISNICHGYGRLLTLPFTVIVTALVLANCFSTSSARAEQGAAIELYYADVDTSSPGAHRSSLNVLLRKHSVVKNRAIWKFLQTSERIAAQPGMIRLFYSRRTTPTTQKASGPNQAEPDYWNREHIWPQSYGLKKTKARFDLHNIVAADRTINTSRGNKVFGMGGKRHNECSECRTDRNSWEPPDQVKGDIARILLYMDIRYEGNDPSGAADLQLVDTETTATRTQFGNRQLMLRWHCADPVSDYERNRNDVAHRFQSNRNPFVDYPGWVEALYDEECGTNVVSAAPTVQQRVN